MKPVSLVAAALSISVAACESPPSPPPHAWQLGRDGVYALDRAAPRGFVPLEGWAWAAEAYACPPDLAVGPAGEAIVTSNVMPVLWRVDAKTLAVSVHPLALDADTDKDVGFTAVAYSPEERAYFAVSAPHRSLWRIDPDLTQARKLPAGYAGTPFNGEATCATN